MALIRFKKPKPHKTREGKIGLTLATHNIDTIIDIGANTGGFTRCEYDRSHDLLVGWII